MRIALLQAPDPVLSETRFAGATLAQYQVRFALAAGCDHIVVIAPKANASAFALQETAEQGGARFQVIADSRSLLGIIRPDAQVLVLERHILPLNESRADRLLAKPVVLTWGTQQAKNNIHQRINGETLWAGVMLIPAQLVERLEELPNDADIPSALLRIALQAGIAQEGLDAANEQYHDWSFVTQPEQIRKRDIDLFRGISESKESLTGLIAAPLVERFGSTMINANWTGSKLGWIATAIALFACLVGWFGSVVVGLFLFAIAWITTKFGVLLSQPQMISQNPRQQKELFVIQLLLDAGLILLLMLGLYILYSRWTEVWFLPMITVGLIRICQASLPRSASEMLGDRAIFALGAAVLTYFWSLELGLELFSLVLLAAIMSAGWLKSKLTSN